MNTPQELVHVVLKYAEKSLARGPIPNQCEESLLIQMGDYWVVRYRGQAAILKGTYGLYYLAYLLCRPKQEVAVTQLLYARTNHATPSSQSSSRVICNNDVGVRPQLTILDSRATLEYKRRIRELRAEAEEAERFNDCDRASRIRSEIDAIANQLNAAFGLGGRDRRVSCNAERARSSATKRIRDAINRIAKVVPPLGSHLATRIQTGYFCSYNPHPERAVNWKILFRRT